MGFTIITINVFKTAATVLLKELAFKLIFGEYADINKRLTSQRTWSSERFILANWITGMQNKIRKDQIQVYLIQG